MSTVLIAAATGLHTLATVVFIGHYLFLSLVYLPVFEQQGQGTALRALLEQVTGRLRPYFGGALLVFLITGTYLMLVNANYLGLGEFFGNTWSILIILKHVLVVGFLALAIYAERACLPRLNDQRPQALSHFRRTLWANTLLGLLIVLLTTVAQVA